MSEVHSLQYVTFAVDELLWGVPISDVQEILPPQPLAPVPLSPASIKGLLNLRGQVIAAVDFRTCLASPAETSEEKAIHAILRVQDEVFSLLVDSVGDVITVESKRFEPVHATIQPEVARLANRICKLETQLMLELNASAFLQTNIL